jgi:hypothetical protein
MKKNMLVLISALSSFLPSVAQTVNGVLISEFDAEYIQIRAYEKLLNSVVTLEIDFGQLDVALDKKDTELRDERGKAMEFNSVMAALNYLNKQGYELMQVYVLTTSSGSSCYYLMRRKNLPSYTPK